MTTKLVISFQMKEKLDAFADLRNDSLCIGEWYSNNLLLLNPSKTKLMVFGSRQFRSKLDTSRLPFMGRDLVPENSTRDLGVILDANLTYDKLFTKTVSKCTSFLIQISRTSHAFYKRTLLTIINALVFSKLFYCSNVWANISKRNINILQAIQNFAARIVTGTRKYDHISPLLKEHNWMPVVTQLYLRTAIMAFKYLTGLVPECLSSWFIMRKEMSGRTTRNSRKLNIPLFKSASRQRTCYHRIVNIWNSLRSSLKTINSMPGFKYSLKRELLKDFIDS